MAKPRILISTLISAPIVFGLSRLYRPHVGVRTGALLDLLLFALTAFGCVKLFQRFED